MWFFKFVIIGLIFLISHRICLQAGGDGEDRKSKILCMIFTTTENWQSKGNAVKNTWLRRCDEFRIFYSFSQHDKVDHPNAIAMQIREGREHLTAKTMQAFRQMYDNYTNSYDWYLKADDDTFIIMENLRHMLSQFDANQPIYLGGRSLTLLKNGYNGGGAGYLLSNEAVRLLVKEGTKHPHECKQDGGLEDLDIGNCLEHLEVFPINTRDDLDRMTFHPDHPFKLFSGQGDARQVYWYQRENDNLLFGNNQGDRMLSPHTISFHTVDPAHMYMYEFLLYELKRHGKT